MRTYWLKIALGALAVFLVGFAGVWVVRTQVGRVKQVIESSDPITVPLAFLPFSLDGHRLGTFRRVTIRRDAPDRVQGLDLVVSLYDSAAPPPEACRLTTFRPGEFTLEQGFRCATPADSALVPIGEVRVDLAGGRELAIPLLLDSAQAASLRSEGVGKATSDLTRGEGTAAAANAEQVRVRIKARMDSARLRLESEAAPVPSQPPKPD